MSALVDAKPSSLATAAGSLAFSGMFAVAFGLMRNKYMALTLGPAGLGILGQLNLYQGTLVSLVGLGLPAACSREIARSRGSSAYQSEESVIATGLLFSFLLGLAAALFTYLGSSFLGDFTMPGVKGSAVLFRVSSSAIVFLVVNALIIGLLQGYRSARQVALVQISTSALGLLVTIPFVWAWGLQGAALQQPLAAAGVSVVSIVLLTQLLRAHGIRFIPWHFSPQLVNILFAVGIAGSIAYVGDTATQLVTRSWLVQWWGSQENGYASVAWALSSFYLAVILGVISSHSFPRINETKEPGEMSKIVNESLHFNLALLAPIVIITAGAGSFLIQILYTSQFTDAAQVVALKAIGDIFYITKWCVGLPLIARGRLKAYVILNLMDNAAMLATSWVVVQPLGANGLAFAYLVANAFGASINYIYQYRTLALHLDRRVLAIGALLLGFMALMLPAIGTPALATLIALIACGIWLLLIPETRDNLKQALPSLLSRKGAPT